MARPASVLLAVAAVAVLYAAGCNSGSDAANSASTVSATTLSGTNTAGTEVASTANGGDETNAAANSVGNEAAGGDATGETAENAPPGAGSNDPLIGKPIGTFSMVSTKGETITDATLKNQVVILDFWATWCGPCKMASPTMEALHKKFGSQGLRVIGANAFEQQNADGAAAGYQKEHGYTYTFTKNNDKFAERLSQDGSIPLFVFVDKKGVVRDVVHGFGPSLAPRFESIAKQLLAEKV